MAETRARARKSPLMRHLSRVSSWEAIFARVCFTRETLFAIPEKCVIYIITFLFMHRDKRFSNTQNTHFTCYFHVTSAEDFFPVLVCSPMPDKYVERYGPVTDVSRQPVPRPLSRPVKRRTSTEDDGQKKKGWFGQFKAEALGSS